MKWPIEPYSVQVQLANAISKLIVEQKEKKIGIFESPTGTGKTLSILVGCLQAMQDLSQAKEDSSSQEEPDWIKAFKSKQQKTCSSEDDSDEDSDEDSIRRKKQHLSREAFLLDDDYQSDQENANSQRNSSKLRLIYCSRTHSQLAQVAKEFSKTTYSRHFKVQMLASRKHLCLNSQVLNSCNGNLLQLNDKCAELAGESEDAKRCPFYSKQISSPDSNALDNFSKELLTQVRDIEDLVKMGKRHGICAYFGSKRGISSAEILLVPYNLLVMREARESLGISLKESIVVFDEAHNIADAITKSHSIGISSLEIKAIDNALERYFSRFRTRLAGKNSLYLQQIMRILRELSRFPRGKDQILSLNDFLYALGIDNINLYKILAFARKSKLPFKIIGYSQTSDIQEAASLNLQTIYNFFQFIACLALPDSAGKIFISQKPSQSNDEISSSSFKFVALNPGFLMQELLECGVGKILLVGGTMQPFDDVQNQLFSFLSPKEIQLFAGDHIVERNNLFCTAFTTGNLNFTFQNRLSPSTMTECGNILLQIASVVPNGIVVFFTCYAYLESIIGHWKSTGTYGKLQEKKSIFLEQKDTIKDVVKFLGEYGIWAKQKRGAILFSVIGGRLSEGINFSDELARAVVVVGLPFPNAAHDAEMRERIAQYQRSGSGTASLFLENICMKSVNQAIGRAIRHKNDYAAILLVDCRFSDSRIQSKLPQWIRRSFYDDCQGDWQEKMREFFSSKGST